LKSETLEISEVFINPYSVLSCNSWTEPYSQIKQYRMIIFDAFVKFYMYLRVERKTSSFIAWDVERKVSPHV